MSPTQIRDLVVKAVDAAVERPYPVPARRLSGSEQRRASTGRRVDGRTAMDKFYNRVTDDRQFSPADWLFDRFRRSAEGRE